MTGPYLVPCLAVLRSEFNALNPDRDKGADGWIGDTAHAAHASDHNPDAQGRVLAIDIDSTGPWPTPFGDLIESLRGDDRLEYVIFNRRIASRDQGWAWRPYAGTSDPHINHAHFSARHDHAGDSSSAPWGLRGDSMLVSKGDSGDQVRFWQYVLTELGFGPGEIDGDYGPKTEAAVNAYRATRKAGPSTSINSWTAFVLLRDLAAHSAGVRPGPQGPAGPQGPKGDPGPPGPSGQLTGTFVVTGGQLTARSGS